MSAKKQTHITQGVLAMLFSVFVWGGWVVTSRMTVTGGHLGPYDVVAIRFTVAGLLLLPIAIKARFRVGPHGIWSGIILMLLMGAPYNIMTISAFQYVPVSHCAIIYAFTTSVTCILGFYWLKEKFSRMKFLGIMLGILGIIAFIFATDLSEHTPEMWVGHILLMAAGSTWGIYAALSKSWRVDPLENTAVMAVFSMLFFLPIYIFFLPNHISSASWGELAWQGFYQGLLTNILALVAYNYAVHVLGASASAAFIPLVPVVATVAAIPLLSEIPNAMECAGIIIAAVGVLLATGALDKGKISLRRRGKNLKNETPYAP